MRKRVLKCAAAAAEGYTPTPPPVSPASALPNNIYTWRGQQIRYQVAGPVDAKQTAVLVHGYMYNYTGTGTGYIRMYVYIYVYIHIYT